MAFKSNHFNLFFRTILLTIIGIFAALFVGVYFIISLPLFIYRFIITKIVAPCFFGKNNVKAVSTFSDALAIEMVNARHSPRSSTVVNLVLDKPLNYDELYQKIEENLINARDQNGKLNYPEFQQYLISWMGFLFWKHNPKFDLKNHVILHKIDENGDDVESESFLCQLCEQLINKIWENKKSPWEMHLIQNYKNSDLLSGNNESRDITLVTLRIHHSMADGYALLHLLLEQLGGYCLDTALVAKPGKLGNSHFKKICNFITFPVKICQELGKIVYLASKRKTILSISDNRKSWMQHYGRAQAIPISKIKLIKNTFGVSFAAVVNSACATALGKMLEKLGEKEKGKSGWVPEELVFGVAVPRTNHPKKLRVHVLGAMMGLPVNPGLDSIERLRKCEDSIQNVKYSPMIPLATIGLKIFSPLPSKLAEFAMKNRYLPTAVTNFPGPGVHIKWNKDYTLLACDFAAGILPGVAGAGFMVLSYVDKIRVCATAESAVMRKNELNEMLRYVPEEIENLFELAVAAGGNERTGLIDSFCIENEK